MAKERLFDFIKGIVIGIANIMPGFSGGIMAVSFNVYDRIICAVGNFFLHPLKTIKDVWALALGGALGIVIALLGISWLLSVFPIPTIMLFCGLIVGSIPTVFNKVKAKKYQYKQIIAFFLGIILIIALPIFTKGKTAVIEEVDFALIITLFFIGIIAAATMVIPGVSGSLILLAFGYYIYIVNFTKDFLYALLSFDWPSILNNLPLVLALGIGIVLGVVLLSKLIEKLLKRHPKLVYSAILGLISASPFAIIYQLFNPNDPNTQVYREILQENLFFNLLIGLIFLTIGAILADHLSKYEKNHPKITKEVKKEKK
ncbi:MAG: DUF368 domain-containing protein [Bacilli bacterium]|nr:DUF368 domain-containing protein [Bacilli bacterium]